MSQIYKYTLVIALQRQNENFQIPPDTLCPRFPEGCGVTFINCEKREYFNCKTGTTSKGTSKATSTPRRTLFRTEHRNCVIMSFKTASRSLFWTLSWVPVALAATDVVHVSKVDGSSMRPTLNPNDTGSRDWVAVKRFRPVANLKINDIVLIRDPMEPKKILCKRVKALSLDTVVDLEEKDGSLIIPRGHVWVEGDNVHSVDSRKFGPVSKGLVVGKVLFIIWPPQRWKTVLDRWVGNNIVIHSNDGQDP